MCVVPRSLVELGLWSSSDQRRPASAAFHSAGQHLQLVSTRRAGNTLRSLSWEMQSEESKCACHACLISYKKFKLMLVWKLIAKWNSSSLVKLSGSFSFNSQNRSCSDEYLICAKKNKSRLSLGLFGLGQSEPEPLTQHHRGTRFGDTRLFEFP